MNRRYLNLEPAQRYPSTFPRKCSEFPPRLATLNNGTVTSSILKLTHAKSLSSRNRRSWYTALCRLASRSSGLRSPSTVSGPQLRAFRPGNPYWFVATWREYQKERNLFERIPPCRSDSLYKSENPSHGTIAARPLGRRLATCHCAAA